MCSPRSERLDEDRVSNILLPERDPIPPAETGLEDFNISYAHLIHLVSSGRLGMHHEVMEEFVRTANAVPGHQENLEHDLEVLESQIRAARQELSASSGSGSGSESTTSTASTEVIEPLANESFGDSYEQNYPVQWSTGVNAPEPTEITDGIRRLEVQNPIMMGQQQGHRIHPVPQPIIVNNRQFIPYRLVPVEQVGPPHLQTVPNQLFNPFGNGSNMGGQESYIVVPGAQQTFGQQQPSMNAAHFGQPQPPIHTIPFGQQQQPLINSIPFTGQQQLPMNPMSFGQQPTMVFGQPQPPMNSMSCQPSYYDERSGRFSEARSYYEGHPLTCVGGSLSTTQPFVGHPSASAFGPSSMPWHNLPPPASYNQCPSMMRFSGSQSYVDSGVGSTERNSYYSCNSENNEWDNNVENSRSGMWEPVPNIGRLILGAPVTWENTPTDSSSEDSSFQTPESSQVSNGSDFSSSDSSSFGSSARSSNCSTEPGTPGSDCRTSGSEGVPGLYGQETLDSSVSNDSAILSNPEILDTAQSPNLNLRWNNKHFKNGNKKSQNSQKTALVTGDIRSPWMYLIDRGTTFYMDGEELPYVINTWDGASKMNPKPPANFEYYVPPHMNDRDFFGGQQHMWQMKMMQYFGKCRPDIWRLQAVPDFQKSPNENWMNFTITTKLRFCCRNCNVPWTSKKGILVFAFTLDCSARRGWIFMKMFGQVCMRKDCQDRSFQTPACYPEEIDRAIHKLFEYISYAYYGIPLDPFIFTECEKSIRVGNPKSHHRKELCQACQSGICQQVVR